MPATENPYESTTSTCVEADHAARPIRKTIRFLFPVALAACNLLPVVGTANGLLGRAQPWWFVTMAMGWLVVTPILCWRSAAIMATSNSRWLIVGWTIVWAAAAAMFNGWVVFYILFMV